MLMDVSTTPVAERIARVLAGQPCRRTIVPQNEG